MFDFISHPGFRDSLESDYAEMLQCQASHAWKSVLVLSGSIVESLLIDYLVATAGNRSGKNPLRMDLAEAVIVCKQENVLKERTADLCSVVRSYRNLIHPGRTIRLGEAAPDAASAQIATALVDLIIDEIAAIREAAFGLTGEQIISKVQRDRNVLPLLHHLLSEVSERERERLLVHLIPNEYLSIVLQDHIDDEEFLLADRLSSAFRKTLEIVSDPTAVVVATQFVEMVKSADGESLSKYAGAFFRATDLRFVAEQQRPLVKQFLLSRMTAPLSAVALETFIGIELYLEASEMEGWIDAIVRCLFSPFAADDPTSRLRTYYQNALWALPSELLYLAHQRLSAWLSTAQTANHLVGVELVTQLLAHIVLIHPGPDDVEPVG